MKKTLIILTILLIFMLTACNKSNGSDMAQNSNNTTSINDNIVSDTSSINSNTNTSSDNQSSNNSSSNINYEPYVIQEIIDERVIVSNNKKIFNSVGVTVSVPNDWKCLWNYGEDDSAYYFRHPELNEKYALMFHVTLTDYFTKNSSKDEYAESLSRQHEQEIVIDTYAKEKIDGVTSIKVAYSFYENDTKFNSIRFDDIIVGFRLYDFTITYPASQSDTFEPILDSILDSIKFDKK